ncbi:hypothetical protein BDN70DRAFT_899188 [Pholiota conissans]|uniref:Uncharacterized protein n=1 Tax=Pholiota conissans TaxID=109636 RepID=A0A9P5YUJ4_9AGAR|nr:hypothetical protein BDN70DRAFT_899188 [Pholiota conissans]
MKIGQPWVIRGLPVPLSQQPRSQGVTPALCGGSARAILGKCRDASSHLVSQLLESSFISHRPMTTTNATDGIKGSRNSQGRPEKLEIHQHDVATTHSCGLGQHRTRLDSVGQLRALQEELSRCRTFPSYAWRVHPMQDNLSQWITCPTDPRGAHPPQDELRQCKMTSLSPLRSPSESVYVTQHRDECELMTDDNNADDNDRQRDLQ